MASVGAKQPPVANAGQAELPVPLVIPTVMSPRHAMTCASSWSICRKNTGAKRHGATSHVVAPE